MKVIFFFGILLLGACNKSQFLNKKPDEALVIPHTLKDIQAILDNDKEINGEGGFGIVPVLGEMGTDDYTFPEEYYDIMLTSQDKNIYTWEEQVFENQNIFDWNYPYKAIFYANAALEGLSQISTTPQQATAKDQLTGTALFHRAHMFYQLAQVFAPPYNKTSANIDLGIPLRMKADVNERLERATVASTYAQVIQDLQRAARLLPDTPVYKTRPGKQAAFALLARVFQTMEEYDQALLYADSCLMINNTLLNFNSISASELFPFNRFNKEVIFHAVLVSNAAVLVSSSLALIDSNLYQSYNVWDLRKQLFFQTPFFGGTGVTFRGSYGGSYDHFGGLSKDEVYLIRAECYARQGHLTEALADLNALLQNRWVTGHFVPVTANNKSELLQRILEERRKELLFRGLRWTDLRRLNKTGANITLNRTVNGESFTLPPNDPRYIYPIPQQVIGFNPSMPQNNRK